MRAFLDAHARGAPVALQTSGTSGRARAVVRTTDSWVCSFAHVAALTGLDARSRVWVPGPLTATMNLFGAVHAAFAGARTVSTPEDATHAQLTPAALRRCLDAGTPPAGVHVVVAGDHLDRPLADRERAAGLRVSHYYGAAELSFVAWGPDSDNLRPFPEVETSARDGALWVRSPYLCRGYAGAPGPYLRDADGFATVGDRGSVVDGRVLVHGRGTDAVTTAGATVLVADVEEALRPATSGELVVVGLPHPDLGAVLAVALTDPLALDSARTLAREALPASHRPRLWFRVPAVPLTAAAKVDRTALAKLLVSSGEGVRRLT